jgi:hypothetical protein
LLVTGRTERRYPVEALNKFEMFDRLGANEARLGLDDELAENRIFASKSALNWVIYNWSVRKNVQCWVQKRYKIQLIMKCKERVIFGDYMLDLKRDQSHGESSQIKTLIIVEDRKKTANTYNSHLI